MPFIHDNRLKDPRKRAALDPAGKRADLKGQNFAEGQAALAARDDKKKDVPPAGSGFWRGFDLKTEAGIMGFVETLGVKMSDRITLKGIIQSAAEQYKTDLAQVLEAFSLAEKGEFTLDRLILNGFTSSDMMWRDTNGEIELEVLRRLALAFPIAAMQVEELVLSGFYPGNEARLDLYFDIFPALRNLWVYEGQAPAISSSVLGNMKVWLRSMRGRPGNKGASAAMVLAPETPNRRDWLIWLTTLRARLDVG